MYVDLYK